MPGDVHASEIFLPKEEKSICILSFVGIQAASISVLCALENLPPGPLALLFPMRHRPLGHLEASFHDSLHLELFDPLKQLLESLPCVSGHIVSASFTLLFSLIPAPPPETSPS